MILIVGVSDRTSDRLLKASLNPGCTQNKEWSMGNGKSILRSLCIFNYQFPLNR